MIFDVFSHVFVGHRPTLKFVVPPWPPAADLCVSCCVDQLIQLCCCLPSSRLWRCTPVVEIYTWSFPPVNKVAQENYGLVPQLTCLCYIP